MNLHTPTIVWLGTGLALFCLACGDSGSGGGTAPPTPEPDEVVIDVEVEPTTPEPDEVVIDVEVEPTEPEPVEPPSPAEPEPSAPATADTAAGAATYQTFCSSCHGLTGDGDTPIAKALDPPPTAHSNGAYMNTLTDAYLFQLVKEGGAAVGKSPMMAPWAGSLSDAQIRDVVAHIRTLAKPPYEGATP